MNNLKIGIIGAGSAVFSMRIISDLCKMPKLSGSHVVLMDIDEARLRNTGILANELSRVFGANLKIETTTDMTKVIDGADFVINTAMAGGHSYLDKVREIGEKHGYYRGIDAQNYNFVSDYLNLTNWNQFSLFLKIAKMIEKFAPNAWYLQAANPVFEGTTLVSTQTSIKMVGFCHGHYAVESLANLIGVKEYDWQVGGVNHGIWLTKFTTKDGKDLYPEIDKYKGKIQHKPSNPFDDQLSPVAWDMYDFYGLFPIGDTVRNSTWKYHRDLETKKRWYGEPWGGADSELGWKWYVEQLYKVVEIINQFATAIENGLTLEKVKDSMNLMPWLEDDWKNMVNELLDSEKLSGEQHVPFIDSVVNGTKRRFVVNMINKGKIKGIDDDVAVEICAWVSGENIEFEETHLPERVINWYIKPRVLLAKQALEAFLKKDTKLVADIIERDWRTKSSEQVKKLIDELYPFVIAEMKKIIEN
ncbi:MAG: alpha-glucosidase/alpha-galactosidase [Fervidobacterium sp.]|uniref:Family 4 glycosyl hydrolase, alpha-galactosidase/6-phospho-beta-glucosidase n=1 Tax=Fervidobacterium pennivorans (strain DSM 9078 / Ven5) TaxID=771875 RepID=H9UE27_FERPD|nr:MULTISPECIES: alpha-glucosidase AglA [Fervidobacterium]AFG35770.1 family 4 glycosyl hydrolase, alpha-galactosidase/6-phospho-beta-glucosidase [Fervidobacterium pennivorans DSM 9078]KAF2961100.1 alpha-glucosidase/alpha-galactosidase [Fervidobacterium sp. 2310opik-2]NPU90028.1 alpha-glucosidase/alpha-galactosidase [Fervidobacterium sp.]